MFQFNKKINQLLVLWLQPLCCCLSIQLIWFLYFVVKAEQITPNLSSIQSYLSSFLLPVPGCWSDFLFSCCPWATDLWIGSNETQLDKLITRYLRFIPQVAMKMLTLINPVSRGHLPNPDYMLPNSLHPTVPMQFHALSILLSLIGCMWQCWK